jgi:tetratricopeptide (TPR) repeat protein
MIQQTIEQYENDYREGRDLESISHLPSAEALLAIGKLINASNALQRPPGMTHAIDLGAQLLKHARLRPRHTALLHSYLANAWSGLWRFRGRWAWDSHELGQELLELRKAIAEEGFSQLKDQAQCSILTNLGNALSSVGRVVEALPLWRRALELIPTFGMALANQGEGLISYARALSWSTQRNAFLEAALAQLAKVFGATTHQIEPAALPHFDVLRRQAREMFSRIPKGHLHRPKRLSVGRSAAEKRYRLWCLRNQLFLNPLNDLMQASPARLILYRVRQWSSRSIARPTSSLPLTK